MCDVTWRNQFFLTAIDIVVIDSEGSVVHSIVSKIPYSFAIAGKS